MNDYIDEIQDHLDNVSMTSKTTLIKDVEVLLLSKTDAISFEQAESAPYGCVIKDDNGYPWYKDEDAWVTVFGDARLSTEELFNLNGELLFGWV